VSREEIGRRIRGTHDEIRQRKKNEWLKLKNKAVHSGRMSGHYGTEEDVDGDWVNTDDTAVGEGGGGLGRKTKEAAVSEDGGNPTQIPKEEFFFYKWLLTEQPAVHRGYLPIARADWAPCPVETPEVLGTDS
jgi:hypothetical protein